MQVLRFIIPLIAAGALAVIAYYALEWLFSLAAGSRKALADFGNLQNSSKDSPQASMGSQPYKIRLAFSGYGLDVSGWEETALYLAYGVVALGLLVPIALAGFPR